MSGINILRRNGADDVARAESSEDKRAQRRNAFEANLALQLEKALGGDASLNEIGSMTRSLGAAYQKMTHTIDARTSIKLGVRRYIVFQTGWAPTTGDYRLDALDPFAAKLLTRLPAASAEQIEPRVKAVGRALGQTEISRRHPMDLRLRLNTPWVRLYLNFLSGPDKRGQAMRVSHNRRKPVNEDLGFFILLFVAGALSLLGLCLIASTLWGLFDLMMTEGGREMLSRFFDNTLISLASFWAGVRNLG